MVNMPLACFFSAQSTSNGDSIGYKGQASVIKLLHAVVHSLFFYACYIHAMQLLLLSYKARCSLKKLNGKHYVYCLNMMMSHVLHKQLQEEQWGPCPYCFTPYVP